MDVPSRRLTTILASDVVGYSLLTSQNEERTVRLVRQRFATVTSFVAQHDGRVFSSAGDALLAEFSSPVEAVRCALEIQEAMRTTNSLSDEADRMLLRIGVNLGDVMTNGTDLLGDGVNVAARLEGLAPPGGVCVSSTVYEQIRGKLTLEAEDLGERQVKNIPHPIRAFNLIPGKISVASNNAASPPSRKLKYYAGAAALAVVISAGGAFLLRDRLTLTDPKAVSAVRSLVEASSAPPVGAKQTEGSTMRPVEASRSKHRPLNPDNIPFLDDTSQQELRRNYLPARESRALAITIHGHYGYATQRIDEEIARRDALATCDKSLHRWTPNPSPQQRCFIYAVGSEVVWTLRPPPMPPQPWLPSFPGQRERLDTHDMPFGADAARALSEYLSSPAHKAIVYGRGARIYLSASRSSGEVAVRAALQRCGFYSEYACLAVAVDDESITRTPKVMRAVDILIPGTLANVSVEDRERINTFYLVQADWRALAVGRNGRIGMATRQDSEQSALDLAMRECVQAAGLECAVAAVGGFVVARR